MHTLLASTLRIGALIALGLCLDAFAAEPPAGLADGWHSWEVAAGGNGRRACCYQVRGGHVGATGCRLGPNGDGLTIDDDCEPMSDRLRVYVLVAGDRVREIHAFSASCPVATSSPIVTTGTRETADSIAWLDRYALSGSDLVDEAVAAIAMHEDDGAFAALTSIIEDRERGHEVREKALFWLAQSDSDDAFRYLDRLLSRR